MIKRRPFGSTGHHSSVTIFGGASLGNVSQATADRTLELLLEHGINHLDTASGYGDSELRMGPWMREFRRDFFLATKALERTYQPARNEIHTSLERLRVDHVDLIQIHALNHPDEWEVALGPGGALEAALDAKSEGLVRFIGVTGHGWYSPALHRRSIQRFPFDSILMPFNFFMMQNERYRLDFVETEELCREKGIAVQTIKSIARGPWGLQAPNRDTWYQPLEDPEDVRKSVHWVLGHGDLFLNTVGDVSLLPIVLEAAACFKERPTREEMLALQEKKQLASLFGFA